MEERGLSADWGWVTEMGGNHGGDGLWNPQETQRGGGGGRPQLLTVPVQRRKLTGWVQGNRESVGLRAVHFVFWKVWPVV